MVSRWSFRPLVLFLYFCTFLAFIFLAFFVVCIFVFLYIYTFLFLYFCSLCTFVLYILLYSRYSLKAQKMIWSFDSGITPVLEMLYFQFDMSEFDWHVKLGTENSLVILVNKSVNLLHSIIYTCTVFL